MYKTKFSARKFAFRRLRFANHVVDDFWVQIGRKAHFSCIGSIIDDENAGLLRKTSTFSDMSFVVGREA